MGIEQTVNKCRTTKGKSVTVKTHSDREMEQMEKSLGWVALAGRAMQELPSQEAGQSIPIMKWITEVVSGKNSCPEDTAGIFANMAGNFPQALSARYHFEP